MRKAAWKHYVAMTAGCAFFLVSTLLAGQGLIDNVGKPLSRKAGRVVELREVSEKRKD